MINISKLLWRSKEFILFFIKATTIYKIHAPFAFRLIQRILENNNNYYAFNIIEAQRESLGRSKDRIEKIEFGEGNGQPQQSPYRAISKLAQVDSSPPNKGQILFKLVNHLEPERILELGTCIGIGTSYLGYPRKEAVVHSVEACPNTLQIAKKNIENNSLENVHLHNMPFDTFIDQLAKKELTFDLIYIDGHHNEKATLNYFERLKPHMNKENCTLIFDDIYWSKGMKSAWEKIKEDKDFKLHLDLYNVGMVFKNTNLKSRASYKLVKSNWKPWISGFFAAKTN